MPARPRSRSLNLALALFALAATLLAVMLATMLRPGGNTGSSAPTPLSMARPGPRIDATADAQARRMRSVTRQLANELSAAARCDARQTPHRFSLCVPCATRGRRAGVRKSSVPTYRIEALARRKQASRPGDGEYRRTLVMSASRLLRAARGTPLAGRQPPARVPETNGPAPPLDPGWLCLSH
jgi:hypothetical protein